MIVLRPYETRLLTPVAAAQWRAPSQAAPLDQMGNPCVQTRFRIRARAHDGGVAWTGWFDDRDDLDAFLWALARGTLHIERPLWDLPTPAWHPWLDEGLAYEFATVTFLSTTGSNQTYSKPADWNNSNNSVECLGAGGSGAAGLDGGGGGGGGYTNLTNITLSGNATYRVGAGGAASGNAGEDTWFNDTSYPTTGTDKVGAKGGSGGGGATVLGGQASAGYPSGGTRYSGGNGPGTSGQNPGGGGGGAAGPNGNGSNGNQPANTLLGGEGGAGDFAVGGAGGAGSSTGVGGTGGDGTEWDGSHGCGGGGGGGKGTSTSYSGGPGGNYGAAGGGGGYPTASAIGGVGIQGLIVVTYEPSATGVGFPFDGRAPFRHLILR